LAGCSSSPLSGARMRNRLQRRSRAPARPVDVGLLRIPELDAARLARASFGIEWRRRWRLVSGP
jgi:hypothetical protein